MKRETLVRFFLAPKKKEIRTKKFEKYYVLFRRKFFIDQGRPRDGRDDIEEARLTTESYDEGGSGYDDSSLSQYQSDINLAKRASL